MGLYDDIPKGPTITAAPDPNSIPGLPASFFDDPSSSQVYYPSTHCASIPRFFDIRKNAQMVDRPRLYY